eukprot:scaffold56242_cov32-Attheya_sp.AAC.2
MESQLVSAINIDQRLEAVVIIIGSCGSMIARTASTVSPGHNLNAPCFIANTRGMIILDQLWFGCFC